MNLSFEANFFADRAQIVFARMDERLGRASTDKRVRALLHEVFAREFGDFLFKPGDAKHFA